MTEPDHLRLERIFHPYATEQMEKFARARPDGLVSFAHYTTANGALGIIRDKRVWMRNITSMVDYSEVLYGKDLLMKALSKDGSKRMIALREAVDACAEGATAEAIQSFDGMWTDIQTNTYVACVSEHDQTENEDGRLSMWRAFGGNDPRVALVFKFPPSVINLGILELVFSPVAYFGQEHVEAELDRVVVNIRDNCDYLRGLDCARIVNSLTNALVAAVTCIKHRGFVEEHEWRLLYAPIRWRSELIERERETKDFGGVPQIIYKIPIDGATPNAPQGMEQLDFARLFDRLIVGPGSYPYSMLEALAVALQAAGLPKPKIVESSIPIRF